MRIINSLFNSDSIPLEIILFIGVLILIWVLIQFNHLTFKKIKKRQRGLHLLFFERVNSAILIIIGIILAFSVFGGAASVWKSLLGGTAIVSAVVAFAAQDAIKDILAGLMISVYRPFEVGNRIELEDGTAGIVEDLTMRHVVLRVMDTKRIIVPNSRLNSMTLFNFSYKTELRSREFHFSVSYDTNVEEAIHVIREAIIQSNYSVPGKKTAIGMDYGPVYFMSFEDSSLHLATMVYYPSTVSTEAVVSDINLRVDHALWEHKIEIPYNYINVLHPVQEESITGKAWKNKPGSMEDSPDVVVDTRGNGMQDAIERTAKLGTTCGLERKDTLRLRLLSEELFGMMRSIVGSVSGHYWVEHDDTKSFAIHLQTDVSMDRELRRQLLSLSSSGQNEAAVGFVGRIRDLVDVMMLPKDAGERAMMELPPGIQKRNDKAGNGGIQENAYVWSMNQYKADMTKDSDTSLSEELQDDLEKSIVASISDDIRISIEGTRVEIIIFKQF